MSSLTLSLKRVRYQSSGWGNWERIYGNPSYISHENHAYVVYSADLALAGEKLTGCSFTAHFGSRGATHAATLHCALYTSDPTSGNPVNAPLDYTAHVQVDKNVSSSGLYQTFTFTGLNIQNVTKLYFWIIDENSSSTPDDLYHDVSCTATFAALPLGLTVSPDELRTGEDVTLTISNAAGRAITANIKSGSTVLATQSVTGDTCTFTCSKAWFDTTGYTMLDQITLTAEVTDGTYTATDYFYLDAGDDMKPVVGTPTVSIVQAQSAASFPNTYIANISKAKVSAEITLPTNATISAVVLSYAGRSVNMTLNSQTGLYEGETTGPLTGDTAFTVTATDIRGLTGTGSAAVTGVVPYTLPSAVIDPADTYRCDSSGVKESGGEYFKVKATATYYSALSGNSLQKFTVKIKNSATETALTSGTQSAAISGMTNPRQAYTIVVTVQHQISGEITAELRLDGMQRDFVLKRNTAGTGTCIGIGMAPEHLSGGCTLELPSGAKIYIGGVEFPDMSGYATTAALANKADKAFTLLGTTTGSTPIALGSAYTEFIVEWADTRYASILVHSAHICRAQLDSTPRLYAYGPTMGGDGYLGCSVSEDEAELNWSNAPSGATFTMKVYGR